MAEIRPRFIIDPHVHHEMNDSFVNMGATNVSANESCVPLKENYVQAVSAVPALVMVENLVFLFAVALYRKKLKHNNVYRYVASALVANVVTSALGFYHFINYYYGFESNIPNPWWAFRKGMTLALSLVLCGNIGLLIYGIEDSTYIVGRISQSSQQSRRLSPAFRKRKANALICIVWALPTVYGLLAITGWNCTSDCTCTLSYESGSHICPIGPCSRLYTPMSKTYLLVVVLLWAIECFGLVLLLCQSINTVRRTDKESMPNGHRDQKYMSLRHALARYNASHRVVFALLGLFFICTAPIMILFVLDFALPGIHFSHALVNFITPLPLVYCLFSPLLVTQKLSGLRSALMMAMTFSWVKHSSSRKSRKVFKATGNTSIVSKDCSSVTPV